MPIIEGDVVLHRESNGRVVITEAPPTTRISLEVLANSDPVVFRVSGRLIRLADQVTYRVVGWDDHGQALIAEREGPWPAT